MDKYDRFISEHPEYMVLQNKVMDKIPKSYHNLLSPKDPLFISDTLILLDSLHKQRVINEIEYGEIIDLLKEMQDINYFSWYINN